MICTNEDYAKLGGGGGSPCLPPCLHPWAYLNSYGFTQLMLHGTLHKNIFLKKIVSFGNIKIGSKLTIWYHVHTHHIRLLGAQKVRV